MYLHPTYAVTPEREALGVLDAWMWAREKKDAAGKRGGPKESVRWVEGYERIAEMAGAMPETRLVYVADHEADLLPLMRRAKELDAPADWLVRAAHNRCLPEGDKLWDATTATMPIGEICFTMASRHGVKERPVRQKIWLHRLELAGGKAGPISVTCIVAREVDAPPGTKPVEWRLLTNRCAASLADAQEMIDWYRARWEIEMLFDIHLMRLGRTCPDSDAKDFFDWAEIKAAYLLTKVQQPEKPGLNEVLRLIARRGGFLGRKSDGEPGVKAIWNGLMKVRLAAEALREAHSSYS